MEEFKAGMVLHGKTDSNESKEHYKIIFKCDKKYIHFISVTTTLKSDNLFEITPKDFYGNNHINGYFNAKNIKKLSPEKIQALIDNKTLKICSYTAKESLIENIITELNYTTKLKRALKKANLEIRELKNRIKNLKSGQANTKIINMVSKYEQPTLSKSEMNEAKKKASNLNEQMGNFKTILSLVVDAISGKYKIDSSVLLTLIGTIVYVISSIDFIPDLIPVLGWLDDIVAVSIAMGSFGDTIEKYKSWKGEE